MNPIDILTLGYCLLLLIGGTIGYMKSGSLASIMMSGIFAAALIASLFVPRFYIHTGYLATKILLAFLTAFFTFRFITTGAMMPAGLFAPLSAALLLFILIYKK